MPTIYLMHSCNFFHVFNQLLISKFILSRFYSSLNKYPNYIIIREIRNGIFAVNSYAQKLLMNLYSNTKLHCSMVFIPECLFMHKTKRIFKQQTNAIIWNQIITRRCMIVLNLNIIFLHNKQIHTHTNQRISNQLEIFFKHIISSFSQRINVDSQLALEQLSILKL